MAMLTLIPMAANAQDSVVVEKVTFSMPTITKDNADDEEVTEAVDTREILFRFKNRYIKDGKRTLLSVNMKYLQTAEALEHFAARFFFRDSTNASLSVALNCYILNKLGAYDSDNKGIADATEKYEIRVLSKVEGLLYPYILSYEKVADGKKRSNKRYVIYDITKKRILQLEDVVNAHLADSIRTDAGKAFINIQPWGMGVHIFYKKQQEQKELIFYYKDDHKFTPSFSETLDAIKKKAKEINDRRVFDVVEDMPAFPGGQEALFKFINEKLRYPKEAEEHGIQGRVICNFVVEKDGSITDVKVQRSVHPLLDKEAVRVLSLMPKWKPGYQNKNPMRVKYTVPISFYLK